MDIPTRTPASASSRLEIEPGYQSGFGNEFATEALPGALPQGRNSPQRAAYGLYAEQLSGTAFTAPRGHNRRSWLYRIRPAAVHQPFTLLRMRAARGRLRRRAADAAEPAALGPAADAGRSRPISSTAWSRWPATAPAEAMTGCAIHLYAANRSMQDRFFYNADGELLIVPQQGRLRIATELGRARRRAAGDRGHSARRALPRRVCPTARHAATSARTSARCCACPISGRSARTAWPIRATS